MPQVVDKAYALPMAIMGTNGSGVLASNTQVVSRAVAVGPPLSMAVQADVSADPTSSRHFFADCWKDWSDNRGRITRLGWGGVDFEVKAGGVTASKVIATPSGRFGAAVRFAPNDNAGSLSGSALATDTTVGGFAPEILHIGTNQSGGYSAWAWIERIRVWDRALSDAELLEESQVQ